MKSSIYKVFILLCAGLVLMACGNDQSDDMERHDTTPELKAEGQYVGRWTRTIQGDTVVATAPGSIVLVPDTTTYVTYVTFRCDSLDLQDSAKANITYADHGFVYYNNNSTNELGTPFYGRIDDDLIHTASFELKVRVGRKFQYCHFQFEGSKTNALP